MSKKEKQWSIDRAFNLGESNEDKFKSILKNIYSIKKDSVSYETAIERMIDAGAIGDKDRYEQSTQTLFTNMGFMFDKTTLNEVSIDYVEGKINYIDLLLLQTFKKQYKRNESYMVRPLIVLLMILDGLKKKDSKYSWVDSYDYMNYLTEVEKYSDIDNDFLDKMISDKKNSSLDRKIDEISDCDIWFNLFKTIKICNQCNDSEKYKIELNEDERPLIDFLLENHNKCSLISSTEDWATEFGKRTRGLYEIIPFFNRGIIEFSVTGFEENAIAKSLYDTLVLGMSAHQTDSDVFINDATGTDRTRGFYVQKIIESKGIPAARGDIDPDKNARGMFKPFKSFLKLLRYSSCYSTCSDIIESIINLLESHTSSFKGFNKIYYGAPGCGKSYKIANEVLPKEIGVDSTNVIRTTFYQDYSYTDFVGQVLPRVDKDGTVTYEFNAGPFTKALELALKHKDGAVVLVIEELNRGSAASIFGDIFQLLDRKKDGSSVYSINNINISDYLKKVGITLQNDKLYIPSNLFIIATMNTSDQNVFTLDTAFKRRWQFEKIHNEFKDSDYDKKLSKLFIPGMDEVTWEELVMAINEYIIANADEFMNEDKQIGVYFIDENGLVENKLDATDSKAIKEFSYKLLEYLWDDVAKFSEKNKWFKESNTLDQLLLNYEKKGASNKANEVFSDNFNDKLKESKLKIEKKYKTSASPKGSDSAEELEETEI